MRLKRPGIHPLDHVLGLTAYTAGAVDVLSFVKLGGILASAMTGNIALLALYSARGDKHSAIASLICLAGFILGGAGAGGFAYGRPTPRALAVLLRAEAVLLALFILCLAWLGPPSGRFLTYISIVPLAAAMGVQIVVGKKLNLASVPTVVFTSTLTNVVITLAEAARAGHFVFSPDTKRQIASLAAYFAGALSSALLTGFLTQEAPWLPLLTIIAAILWHRRAPA